MLSVIVERGGVGGYLNDVFFKQKEEEKLKAKIVKKTKSKHEQFLLQPLIGMETVTAGL